MIDIDTNLCIGCGLCLMACADSALVLENGTAKVTQGCTGCGLCVDACPSGAISVSIQDGNVVDQGGILVVGQITNGAVTDVTLSLCQKARELFNYSKGQVFAALFGPDATKLAPALIAQGADTVFVCEDRRLTDPDDGLFAATLYELIQTQAPSIVLFGATAFGRSLAPRMAARLGTGLTADCTELSIDEKTGLLQQTRPAFGGNLLATIVCPHTRPQMATVRPGVFPVSAPVTARCGEIIPFDVPEDAASFYTILTKTHQSPAQSLASANIIVTAGRGIGGIKNMQLVRAFAERIGAQVAVSRPLVDAGYGEQHQQIGQTGHTVAPSLLITLGVSGAIQHLAGIGGAKTIIAINTDPDAPIFSVADYAIVGDCVELLQQFLA